MHRTTPKLSLLLVLPLLLTACGAPAGNDDGAPSDVDASPSATSHGFIAGAQENAEAQTGLLTIDAATGQAQLLSLLTEETVDAGSFGPVSAVHQDGRYALMTTDDGVEVFDTGAWTVPHGDHSHYYSAEPGLVGSIEIPDAGAVAGNGQSIAVFSQSGGYASIYTHKDLDADKIIESARITTTPHEGRVIPFKDHFITTVADDGGAPEGVEVRDADDQTVLEEENCPGATGHASTKVGIVLACTDGALLIMEDDGEFSAERIPYPADAAGIPPATTLEHRPRSNELAAPAGDSGIWHLDVSTRTWTHHETPVAVVTASAVGDTKRVLALGADGSLLTIHPKTGEVTDQVDLIEPLPEDATPQLRIDTSRAYLSDPETSTVYEIDYSDALRTARTFDVPGVDLMLETGL